MAWGQWMAISGRNRAPDLVRQLGLQSENCDPQRRYARQPSSLEFVDIVVFSAHGFDNVGISAKNRRGREFLNANEQRWIEMGLTRHQAHPDSHKTAVTFRRAFPQTADGTVAPEMKQYYQYILSMIENR